jgi:hypothetical protein
VARQAHAAVAHRRGARCEAAGCLVIFGGCDARDVPLDDLWLFSLRERRWTRLRPAPGGGGDGGGAWPSARHHHTLTALSPPEGGAPRGALLFGGVGLRAALDDAPLVDASLWWLSLDQPGGWTRVHIPAGASQPDRRLGHGGVGLNASLWLVGGLAVQGAAAADAATLPVDTSLRHVWRFGTAGDGGAVGSGPGLLSPKAVGVAGVAGVAGAVGGCALGCGPHGACDLRHARCVCASTVQGVPARGSPCGHPLAPEAHCSRGPVAGSGPLSCGPGTIAPAA